MRTGTSLVRQVVGPSLTATLVHAVRALYAGLPAPYRVAPDATASELLPLFLGLPARAAGRLDPSIAGALHVGLGTAALGMTYHIVLRTLAIDEALLDAVRRGVGQVVLLGAGLDNRAARLDELAGLRVFEVDHPSTQQYKQRRLAAAGGRRPVNVTPVRVDFERDRLDERLQAEGLSASEPTFWIWEGVTIYLSRPAITATLEAVGRCSAAGSRIAVTYTRPSDLGGPVLWAAAMLAARLVGEPVRGALSDHELATELSRVAFRVVSDESPLERAPGVWPTRPPGLRAWERVAVAERT